MEPTIAVPGEANVTIVEPPRLRPEQTRWATTRTCNVDVLSDQWRRDPDRVIVFSDPKLKDASVVMLRKDRFEMLQKLVNDLVSGQAFVEHNLKTIVDALIAAKDHIELKSQTLPNTKELDPILKQINVLLRITQSMETRIVVKSSGRKPDLAPPGPGDLVEDDEE